MSLPEIHKEGLAMTGKELKAFAEQVHDEAEIEIREITSSYGRSSDKPWTRDFEIQATLVYKKKDQPA